MELFNNPLSSNPVATNHPKPNLYFGVKWILWALIVANLLSACANNPFRSYKSESDNMLNLVDNNNLSQAIADRKGQKDIMSYLELGSLYRLDNNYPSSINNLNTANWYVKLWLASYHNGKGGAVIDEFQAGLLNDRSVDYQIKDYEKVMIATYLAMNRLNLNQPDGARIEIKRMYDLEDHIRNYRQKEYAELKNKIDKASQSKKYKDAPTYAGFRKDYANRYNFATIDTPSVLALKNSYQNAFSHYLAGYVFESLGEYSMARPGYLRALELNPDNSMIQQAIHNLDNYSKPTKNTSDMLIIEEVGHAPQFQSQSFNLPWMGSVNNQNCGIFVKFSFPSLVVDSKDRVANFTLDQKSYYPEEITNINLMAARYLHDNLPNIFWGNVIRGIRDASSQLATCAATKSNDNSNSNDGLAAAALVSIFGQVMNEADERTWVMLPSGVYITRLKVPYGRHLLRVLGYNIDVEANSPYQIVSFRVLGNSVYFMG